MDALWRPRIGDEVLIHSFATGMQILGVIERFDEIGIGIRTREGQLLHRYYALDEIVPA